MALPTLAALIASLSTVDLAYQLRAGAEVLDGRGIPTVDTWTFTAAGAPWFDQQWGAQVLLAGVYRVAGWTGLVVLRAALVAMIFGCLFEIGRRRGLGLRRSAWLTLAAFVVAAPALGLRPQIMGMALFALVLLLVSDRRRHPGRLWAIPLVVLIWANIHGSFFLGPLVLGLAWLEDLHDRVKRPHRTLLVAAAAAASACITPFGPAVWAYAVGLSANPEVTRRITEWQPTSLRDVPGLLFFGSAAALGVLLARTGRPVPWPALAWLGLFLFIGAYAIRGVAWWSLAAVPVVASLVPTREGRPPDASGTLAMRRVNGALGVAIVVAGIVVLPFWRPIDPALGAPVGLIADAPPGVTASLREAARPGDRLFNPQAWGSWFEFAVPDLPVAIDSRIELFPAQVWDDYARVAVGSRGWGAVLDRWDVTLVAVEPGDSPMADLLASVGWTRVFGDASGSLFRAPEPIGRITARARDTRDSAGGTPRY